MGVKSRQTQIQMFLQGLFSYKFAVPRGGIWLRVLVLSLRGLTGHLWASLPPGVLCLQLLKSVLCWRGAATMAPVSATRASHPPCCYRVQVLRAASQN